MAEQVEQTSKWAKLPSDLCGLIVERLLLHDITRFRSVCRAWKSTPNPRVLSPVEFPLAKSQWLMGASRYCKFFHPACKEPYREEIPEMSGTRVYASRESWLLLPSANHSSFFFLNPFTKQVIRLPNFPLHMGLELMTFSCNPTHPDCIVLGVCGHRSSMHISILRRGEGEWKPMLFRNNLPFLLSCCNPEFHHGKFYCLGEDGNLGVFDPNPSTPTWQVHSNPTPLRDDHISFLVGCNGSLIAVFLKRFGEWISVNRLEEANMTWEKVGSLGDWMLFLSRKTSLSAERVIPGMENKIYFPYVLENSPVFYSIGARTLYHVFGRRPLEDLYETTEYLQATWIEPNAHIYSPEELTWATFDHDSKERPLILFRGL